MSFLTLTFAPEKRGSNHALRSPDLTTVALELAFSKLADRLSCEMCRASLRQRLQEVLAEWSNVKVRGAA